MVDVGLADYLLVITFREGVLFLLVAGDVGGGGDEREKGLGGGRHYTQEPPLHLILLVQVALGVKDGQGVLCVWWILAQEQFIESIDGFVSLPLITDLESAAILLGLRAHLHQECYLGVISPYHQIHYVERLEVPLLHLVIEGLCDHLLEFQQTVIGRSGCLMDGAGDGETLCLIFSFHRLLLVLYHSRRL